ncbi:hypothetical protein RRG08_043519 [Elysia crispata]|uniref:Uncharacterized protein n=1 Tax=Elysia crispata TaxID=231223 RepID=A0AAE0YH42_9GAST|nr:hypothetical protein RRG08_043519 [Elysia crispata]
MTTSTCPHICKAGRARLEASVAAIWTDLLSPRSVAGSEHRTHHMIVNNQYHIIHTELWKTVSKITQQRHHTGSCCPDLFYAIVASSTFDDFTVE